MKLEKQAEDSFSSVFSEDLNLPYFNTHIQLIPSNEKCGMRQTWKYMQNQDKITETLEIQWDDTYEALHIDYGTFVELHKCKQYLEHLGT